MPDRGLRESGSVEMVELATAPQTLVWQDARWLQVTFEVDRQAALRHLPPDIARPIPCYARIVVADGMLGGTRVALAALLAGGRFRMMPRNVLAAAVTEGGADRVRGLLGSGVSEGTVRLERTGQHVVASVAPLVAVTLPGLYAIEPAMLRWDPWLGAGGRDGATVIAETTVLPEIDAAYLSREAAIELAPELSRESAWRQFRNAATISACYAEGTLTLRGPEVQQAWT